MRTTFLISILILFFLSLICAGAIAQYGVPGYPNYYDPYAYSTGGYSSAYYYNPNPYYTGGYGYGYNPYYTGYYGGYAPNYSGYGGYGYGGPGGYSYGGPGGYGGYGYGGYSGCGGYGPPGGYGQSPGCGHGKYDPSTYFYLLSLVTARLQSMQMLYGNLYVNGALGNSAAILLNLYL